LKSCDLFDALYELCLCLFILYEFFCGTLMMTAFTSV